MRDPDDEAVQGPTETMQVGPARPSPGPAIPTGWRRQGGAAAALLLGVAGGAGAVLWWHDSPEPRRTPPVHEHAVELVLVEAAPRQSHPVGAGPELTPLRVESVLLLSGLATSTVSKIGTLGDSLHVRARALPVTVSPTRRLESINLEIVVRDCAAATGWTPADRPFTIAWEDEYGGEHTDRAGDLDSSLGDTLVRYIDSACPRS